MSTRSYICVEQENGMYTGVYCHSDGYPEYNGAMLLDHYNSREKANEILALGGLSSLREKLYPDPTRPHSFDYDNQQEDVTVAYMRDRGEKEQEARSVTLKDLNDPESWIDYIYIFTKENKWQFFECGYLGKGLQDVNEWLENFFKAHGVNTRPKGEYGWFEERDFERLREMQQQTYAEM